MTPPATKTGTLLAQRARRSVIVWFFLYLLYVLYFLNLYFFGLDSGGTKSFSR